MWIEPRVEEMEGDRERDTGRALLASLNILDSSKSDGNPFKGVKQRRDIFKSDPAMWAWKPEKKEQRLVKSLF